MTLFFVACSSPQPNNSFSRYAILIDYESTNELNVYNNQAHVIPLVVYQLNDINSFNTLKKDNAGIVKLLEANKFDKSVMSVNKYFVSPNQNFAFLLDRASGTKWVALVVGYYNMQASQSTLEYQIPEYNPWDIFKSEEEQKLLKIKVYFERSSIEKR
jgi:predicted component of type VI protein secretion system